MIGSIAPLPGQNERYVVLQKGENDDFGGGSAPSLHRGGIYINFKTLRGRPVITRLHHGPPRSDSPQHCRPLPH
jgi:hypothetical protein